MDKLVTALFLATLLTTVGLGGCGGLEPAEGDDWQAKAEQADQEACMPGTCGEGVCLAGRCFAGDADVEFVLAEATIADHKTHWDEVYTKSNGYLPDPFVMIKGAWVPEKETFDGKSLMSSLVRDTMAPVWQKLMAVVPASALVDVPTTITVLDWDEWNPLYWNDLLGRCTVKITQLDLARGGFSIDCGEEGHVLGLRVELSASPSAVPLSVR